MRHFSVEICLCTTFIRNIMPKTEFYTNSSLKLQQFCKNVEQKLLVEITLLSKIQQRTESYCLLVKFTENHNLKLRVVLGKNTEKQKKSVI